MENQSDMIIKQNSPKNILWRLFRILVEEERIPKEITKQNREVLKEKIL